MEKLPIEVNTNSRTYRQIKRDNFRAMYLSDEGYYEIFRIDVKPEMEVFGKVIPEHEHYPTTNDFGKIAWCTANKDKADKIYNAIEPKKSNKT